METNILAKTPYALDVLWGAIRTCKSSQSPKQLFNTDKEDKEDLVRRVVNAGHGSVLEHITVSYSVSGVSRALLSQLSRHRVGVSLSVRSQRYVNEYNFGFVVPPSLEKSDRAKDLYLSYMDMVEDCYSRLLEEGIPKEDARMVLPNATHTDFVVTVNLRSLLHLWVERVEKKGSQWEIKQLVEEMVRQYIESEPWAKVIFNEV